MSLKTEAIKRFLTAARSLANQGMSKEAIMQFAKNEFGEITELFQRQIDNIFKPGQGIKSIKIKDPDFDDTVIKMQFDEEGIPFNPKDPLKYYGAPKKSITERMDDIKETNKKLTEALQEYENIYKPKQNKPDVYGIRDYDTTNMSEIKQQIIKTENKLGNLNPDSPDFKEKAKALIDEIEDLKGKLKDEKPRTDKYTGGMVDVEPNLSDIGHGSDALMARTRLISPGAQGTTSTGLNYLLAEDNDNIRIPFNDGLRVDPMALEDQAFKAAMNAFKYYVQTGGKKNFKDYMRMQSQAGKAGGGIENFRAEGGRIGFSKGKIAKELLDKGRRGFMKTVGSIGAGIAGLKSGLLGFGDQAGPKVEMVKETVTGAPDYFFDLVSKIKMFGKKSKIGPQERVDEYSYTGANGDDYTLTEDIVTGDARIVKDKTGAVRYGEDDVTDGIANRSVMEYKSGKGMADEGTGGALADEYDEYEVRFDYDGTEADADDMSEFIKKEIIEEVSDKTTKTKKADGGRIGYSKGKLIKTIGSRTLAFLEKIFGKEAMAEMPSRDPELYKGLLEVTEAFRARDKEGLKMYLQKYLPHMDDTEIEEFIIGTRPDIQGIQGQLLRLGSGRDYKGKLDMMREASQKRKLADLEVTEDMKRKPNASGGIAKLLGE